MQDLCCPTCGQRYSSPQKRCPKDGTALVPLLVTQEFSKPTHDLNKTIQDGVAALPKRNMVTNLVPGVSVGEYVLIHKIGVGGMGEVWKAEQPTIGKTVAIKVLTPESATSKKSIARFVQEARAVNEIRHPNLVDIFSFGELPDLRPYFVMELLNGQSLGDYMEFHGPLPFADIIRVFSQVCEVLQAAHDKEIVHRDLKPDNIFLIDRPNEKHFVKVLDFGIAKLAGEGQQNLTEQGAVFGTPGYMSPEQYEETKNVDNRSDIYSLGVLLFEMLAGRTPFDEPGLGMYELIIRQMSQPAPLPSKIATQRSIPREVDALVAKMLSKKPAERPSSCREVLQLFLAATTTTRGEKKIAPAPTQPRAEAKTLELTSPQSADTPQIADPIDAQTTRPVIETNFTAPKPPAPAPKAAPKQLPAVTPAQPLPAQLTPAKNTEKTSPIALAAIGFAILLISALLTFLLVK